MPHKGSGLLLFMHLGGMLNFKIIISINLVYRRHLKKIELKNNKIKFKAFYKYTKSVDLLPKRLSNGFNTSDDHQIYN